MSAKQRTYQNLLQGSMILAVATALVKVLGAIYRIPLNNMLGELGAGYYSTAYDLYLPIYSLAMAGLPVAISRMVAESVATKRFADTRRLLKLAQRAFLTTGITGTVLMVLVTYFYLYNDWFRTTFNITADQNCVYAIVLIAFSILFCCIMSTYRGYYEGLRNMIPTAVSQVIEAAGKLVLGLVLVWVTKYVCISVYGMTETQSLPYAAGAAVLGVTLGALSAYQPPSNRGWHHRRGTFCIPRSTAFGQAAKISLCYRVAHCYRLNGQGCGRPCRPYHR